MSELYEIQANNVRLKGLESRFEGLTADHEALSQQIRDATNLADRGRFSRQLLEIGKELVQVAQAIDQLKQRNKELDKTASIKLPEQLHSTAGKLQEALLDILVPYELAITVNRETAYRSVCSADWLRPMSVSLRGMLADLEDMQPDERGDPAILKFVAYLITDAQVPELLSKQLNQWAEAQSQNFSQLLQQIRPQPLQTGQPVATTGDRQTDSYLMVVVNQSNSTDQEGNRYFVKAWFIVDKQDYQPRSGAGYHPLPIPGKLEDAEKTFTCDEIRILLKVFLDESRRECQRQQRSLRNLTIELFLPPDLLNHAIDGWVVDEEDEFSIQEPIGFHHCVHLRSSDRLRPEYLLRRRAIWQEKWDSVQQLAQQMTDSTFVSGDGMPYKKLFQALDRSDIVGLKIAQGPLLIGKESAFAVLQAAATPLALWLRQPLPKVPYDIELAQVLDCCLHAIPERVKQQRKDAFSEDLDAHIGHHLALMWEDVNRLPPDLDYQVAQP